MPTDNSPGGPDEGSGQYQVLRVIKSQIAMVRDAQVELDRKLSAQAAIVEELVRGVSADMRVLLARERDMTGRGTGSAGGCDLSRRDMSSIPSNRSAEVTAATPTVTNVLSASVSVRHSSIRNLADIQTSPDLCRAVHSKTGELVLHRERVFPLKPDSFVRLLIDCCTISALVFDAFSVPFVLAWDPPVQGFLRVTMFGTTAIWVLDMCANFVTGYYEDGVLITDLPSVVRHYLRHLFILDFTIIALDVVNIFFELSGAMRENSTSGSMTMLTLFRVFKIQRLIRFLAILRLGRMWPRVTEMKGMIEFSLARSKLWLMLIEIVKFLVVILWLNHVLCCIFYAIGKVGGVDTGESWLDDFAHPGIPTSFEYTTAFHYTITQMTPGSMDVFAKNSLERVFTIMWLLFGLLFGSSLVSYLSAHLVQVNQQNTERSKMQATLRRFLRQHSIQAVLAYRVEHDIMSRATSPAPLLEREIPCLSNLTGYLRSELWLALFTPHISPHPLFYTWHFIDPFTTRDICFVCHFVYLPSGEELFEKGCRKTSAHILADGKMQYVSEEAMQITDGAWISEAAWWMCWTTRGCMETLTECKLVCLEASQLMEVLTNHPHTEALILAYGQAFHKLASSMPRDQLSDLNFLDHGEVVSHMPREERTAIAEIVLKQTRSETRRTGNTRGFGVPAGRALDLGVADVLKLKAEVERGQCALVFGREGRPVRVVSIVVLHIVWPSRGRMIAQLAKVREAESTPRCQLPATKCNEDESPHDAAVRLFSDLRALLPDGYEEEFGDYETIVVHQEKSESYANLPSRFTRSIFHLKIQEPDDAVDCRTSPRIHSIHSAHEPEAGKLFSWLSLEDYDRFSTGIDTEDLSKWIENTPLEDARIEC